MTDEMYRSKNTGRANAQIKLQERSSDFDLFLTEEEFLNDQDLRQAKNGKSGHKLRLPTSQCDSKISLSRKMKLLDQKGPSKIRKSRKEKEWDLKVAHQAPEEVS